MTTLEVRKLYQARPFQRFYIQMADGRSVRVDHPEWMAFSPGGRTVIVYERDGSFEIIDLLLVTGVKVPVNGKAKARR
ncbi:MAG: hypothetical protein ABSE73_25940 [Planctomycetota bacterium]